MSEPDEGIDMDDIDEAIQDATSNDEGRCGARSLLHYLAKRGLTIAPAAPHDYPRPVERLIPAGPSPRGHVHVWASDGTCRECGESRSPCARSIQIGDRPPGWITVHTYDVWGPNKGICNRCGEKILP